MRGFTNRKTTNTKRLSSSSIRLQAGPSIHPSIRLEWPSSNQPQTG